MRVEEVGVWLVITNLNFMDMIGFFSDNVQETYSQGGILQPLFCATALSVKPPLAKGCWFLTEGDLA